MSKGYCNKHKPNGINDRNLLSPSSRNWKPDIKGLLVPPENCVGRSKSSPWFLVVSLVYRQCSPWVSTSSSLYTCLICVQSSCFIKDVVMLDWAPQVALVLKNLPASVENIRDMDLIPGLGRSLGGGHGHLLQYSYLKNSMSRGALVGYGP